MMNQARQAIASEDDEAISTGKLHLDGTEPVTIYMAIKQGVPAFSLTQTGGYHTGAIVWRSGSSALTITFSFSPDEIEKITTTSSNLTLGDVISNPNASSTQDCTVATATTRTDDPFTVVEASGKGHDPKIVVTPQ